MPRLLAGVGQSLTKVLVPVAVLVLFASPIRANDFGSDWPDACNALTSAQCTGENADHRIYFSEVQAQRITIATQIMQYQYTNVSDINMYRTLEWVGADALVYDALYGMTGWWGVAQCTSTASYGGSASNHTRWCKPQMVRFNESYAQATGQPDYIFCHELGHTIGLRHSGEFGSCMNANMWPGPVGTTTHDRGHINSRY